jgi:hypothetical protein
MRAPRLWCLRWQLSCKEWWRAGLLGVVAELSVVSEFVYTQVSMRNGSELLHKQDSVIVFIVYCIRVSL